MRSQIQVSFRLLAMAGAAAAAWGCAATTEQETTDESGMSGEIGNGKPEAGRASSEGSEVQKAVSYTTFFQNAFTFTTTTVASTDKLCVVSEVLGDTHGWGAVTDQRGFHLYQTGSDTWSLKVWNINAYVGGTCVNRSAFRVPSGGRIETAAGATANADTFGYVDDEYSAGDTVGYLSGFASNPGTFLGLPLSIDGGGFEGMGEMVRVNQANAVDEGHVLRADVDHAGRVTGYASSFRLGVDGDTKPKFWGYKDGSMIRTRWGTTGTTFTMNISTFNGYSGYWMAQTADAMCVLTRYQGRLAGENARVHAYFNGTQWKSSIKSSAQAEASFRCMAYDQR